MMALILIIAKVEYPQFYSIMFLFVGTVEPEDEIANNATTFATQEFDDGFASHYHQG